MVLKFLFVCFLFQFISADVIVELPNGKIRGRILSTQNSSEYYAFQQIPYAEPPLGELRFKSPVPVKNWDGILNTTSNTKICYQSSGNNKLENEDCLYLNVYTPTKPGTSSDLSVIVYIHGGAFVEGESTFQSTGPEYFIDNNVIVVTALYRLGPFGFLSTQDDVIPGNNGLKDVLLALKWVQNNIELFGGNRSKVTLAGESAGAALVGYHVISKQSQGLFRAAIMESGSALCSWAYQRYATKYAYELASAVDESFTHGNSSSDLLKLLQGVTADEIKQAKVPGVVGLQLGQGDLYAPVIENEEVEDAFITEFMHTSLSNGRFNQVPVIMGVNSEELIYLAADIDGFKKQMSKYDENITLIINEDYRVDKENLTTVGNLIRKIYVNDEFQNNLGGSIKFRSDVRYTTAVSRQAALQAKYSDVYFYQFSYKGVFGTNVTVDGADRVAHAEELGYLWRQSNADFSTLPEKDVFTHIRLSRLWSDFIKYLDPTPQPIEMLQNIKWPKMSESNFTFINIDEDLEIQVNPKKYLQWKEIIDVYGNPPFDTY